jgi:hypothetical protein
LASKYDEAVKSLELEYKGFALDIIRTQDSFGNEVVRYGYYPRLASVQNRKRSASVFQDEEDAGAGAGGEGPSKMPRTRKMSRSEMVCLDETSSEMQTETEDSFE